MGQTNFRGNPVIGALTVLPFTLTGAVTSTTYRQKLTMPAGIGFKIVSAQLNASAVASDPSLTIGTTTTANAFVAAVNVTTNLGALTLVLSEVKAGSNLVVTIANDTGDTFAAANVSLIGFFTGALTGDAYVR